MISLDSIGPQMFNVFEVVQIAPHTFVDELAGLDYVRIAPASVSEIHRHNYSDNLIYVIRGSAVAMLDGVEHEVFAGMRVVIPKAVAHGFRTNAEELEFISIQIPPILDKKNNVFDREILDWTWPDSHLFQPSCVGGVSDADQRRD